ncbi:MAG: RNA polymerase sigma factor [bacterium]
MAKITDAKLLQNSALSDFKELFETYHDLIFSVCYRMTGNRTVAEDLTQDVFFNAYKAHHEFRNDSQISTWLYRIAVNVSLNYETRKKRVKWFSLDVFLNPEADEAFQDLFCTNDTPQAQLEQAEREQRILKAINSLPPKQRIALLSNKYEGLSYEAIALSMNCSVNAVRSYIFRAKQTLSRKLNLSKERI